MYSNNEIINVLLLIEGNAHITIRIEIVVVEWFWLFINMGRNILGFVRNNLYWGICNFIHFPLPILSK